MSGQGGAMASVAMMAVQNPQRLAALCALWQEAERDVWLTLQGESMVPTILPGARLCLRCRPEEPQIGEVIAFRRGRALVVHRLMAIAWTDGGERRLICRGDNNGFLDEPIQEDDMVGIVVAVRPPDTRSRMSLAVRRALRPWRQRWRSQSC